MDALSLMERLQLKHRPSFRQRYLQPALAAGFIVMTRPGAPQSNQQRYRLTAAGQAWVRNHPA
jgi:hypothetical protein